MKKNRRTPNNIQKNILSTAVPSKPVLTEFELAYRIVENDPKKYHTLSENMQCSPAIITMVTSKTFTVYDDSWGGMAETEYKKEFIPISAIPIDNIKKAFTERHVLRSIINKHPSLIVHLKQNFNEQNMVYFADYFNQFSKDLKDKFMKTNFSLDEKQTILRLNNKLISCVLPPDSPVSDKINIAICMINISLYDAMKKCNVNFSDEKTWEIVHNMFKNSAKHYNVWERHILYFVEAAELIIKYGSTSQKLAISWIADVYEKYKITLSYDENEILKKRCNAVLVSWQSITSEHL